MPSQQPEIVQYAISAATNGNLPFFASARHDWNDVPCLCFGRVVLNRHVERHNIKTVSVVVLSMPGHNQVGYAIAGEINLRYAVSDFDDISRRLPGRNNRNGEKECDTN